MVKLFLRLLAAAAALVAVTVLVPTSVATSDDYCRACVFFEGAVECGPPTWPPGPSGMTNCYVYVQCFPFAGGERCFEQCEGDMCTWT